ncbi:ribonuclease HIII [Lederbergia wuyishanensis]|uniref:Ribonuclease HIII n=1 Tax=Lederbergia wuyishanensis TaxID=1347903 RepID=A0ABU0D588_9BACI|nr:ribonuclease HIII [Lederbergia wuyishanensis]MCJ8009882.1 ribonuclease HIII [Lederbergia wuyishanensis]MDQ0343581.1 ribonuclease HIII [Lederbergia wuyishanensis]
MANIVIQLSSANLEKINSFYEGYKTNKTPPGAIFIAKKNGCTITAYRSGKVMFQGAGNLEEAKQWGASTEKLEKPIVRKSSGISLPPNFSSLSAIGSDEVGKGDYFGPMTVVAAYVKTDQMLLLKELGVKDSKDLTDSQIIKIAKDLITFLPYSLLTLTNEKYNKLQSSGMTQGKITAILHNQALNHLLKKIEPEKPDAILIDQFAEATTYYRHLQGQKEILRENVYFSTKAESIHLSVAAASILARYAFLKAFDELSKKAGFSLTKGAGHKVDHDAARLIKTKGLSSLNQFTKLHFANTNKARKIAGI